MRIGITCYPTYGGSGVVATELGKALARRGHEIHFIAYAPPQRLAHFTERIYFHEVRVNTYPLFEYPPYSLALTSKMIDVVKHEQLDLLHVHYAIPHATSAVLARQILACEGIRVPVVTTLHGTDITLVGQDASFTPVVTHAINASDGVTAVSDYLRHETHSHFDVERDVEVIPNFVDTDRFTRQQKGHFKRAIAPNGEKLLIHVSNFREVKRASDVVHVFHRLHEGGLNGNGPGVKLLLVGDGPDRPATEVLARELGVYGEVRFLGKQEPIEEILSVADVFLMPSGSETFGLAALEAMACGVPVVSTDIGGIPELNLDGETGFLCPLADVDCLTDATRRILTDEALHARMAEAARRRAVEHFDINRIVPQYEGFYQQMIDRAEHADPVGDCA
ncbi:MAG: N-acetyl-alpha-D-glucosaminyl L-malate synthase BshA [Bacteroidota bacterium]